MRRLVPLLIALSLVAVPAVADEPELGWRDRAELSLVATSGNSEGQTFGFNNTLEHLWEDARYKLVVSGLRTETTDFDRFAVGPGPGSFTTFEREDTETTAEAYSVATDYSHEITERLSWQLGASWERDRFAGIDDRYTAYGGVTNVWRDEDDLQFRTDYLLTYTDQTDVVPQPGLDDSFLGARFAWEYLHGLTETVTYENKLALDYNFDESEDWRSRMLNALSVKMTQRLALKVSLLWKYDNLPAFESVPLYDMDPSLPGAVQNGTVPFQLDESDFVFTTSLVIDF